MSLKSRQWLTTEENELVRTYWERAGEVAPFPRSLESSMGLALPLSLVTLPSLTLRSAQNWLRARGKTCDFACDNRPVHGCLAAEAGHGVIFVDSGDPTNEIRFTVAHEIGHFLADVLLPRKQALKRFGPQIAEVLDGKRQPTFLEKTSAAFRGLPMPRHTSFLERSGTGVDALRTWKIEDRADRIGLALLAPPEDVLAVVADAPVALRSDALVTALREQFGLPYLPAQRYAEKLLGSTAPTVSLAEFVSKTVHG